MIDSFFHSYNISTAVMKKSIFVIDRGSNMVKAFSGLPHLNCICHILNNILHDTFQSQRSEAGPLHNDWINLLETSKTVVKYLKHTGLTRKLSKTLHQPIDVRWNSYFYMLESIQDQYVDIELLLMEENESLGADFSKNVYRGLLDEVVDFLKPFNFFTKILSGNKYITITKVRSA